MLTMQKTVIAIVMMIWGSQHVHAGVVYTVSAIPSLGGTRANPFAINDAGTVVGFAFTAGDVSERAFIYSNGVTTDLGTGGTRTRALAINNNGVVVGVDFSPGRIQNAVWENGTIRTLPNLGGWVSAAHAINDSGQQGNRILNDCC